MKTGAIVYVVGKENFPKYFDMAVALKKLKSMPTGLSLFHPDRVISISWMHGGHSRQKV